MKLNNSWQLYFVKESSFNGNIKDIFNYDHFDNVTIPALFELEIFKHGLLGDPYKSTNNWDYQKYEDYHQFYVLRFNSNRPTKYLKINGIDTLSEIYLNDELIGKTDNMFIPYSFKLRHLKKENVLIIHILPSVVEGRKFDTSKWFSLQYNYEGLYLRKCASSFGWDILPRTPLGGIYKDIELLDKLPIIENVRVTSSRVSKESATLDFKIEARNKEKYTFKVYGKCLNRHFYLNGEGKIKIYEPLLWNIRGYGEPYLYSIKAVALKNGKVVETYKFKYGIRKVELLRSSVVEDGGKFEFHINGEKVFLLGSNWVPIEAIRHHDDERMLKALDMLTDLGCNSLRVWGGGVYESDLFYQKCDELGIFIWQDFMMGCGVYPQDKCFQEKIKIEAECVVKRLRNHPSICLWAGDNENDLACYWSRGKLKPNQNVLTRKILPNVIKKFDGYRPYLPSSPFVDQYAEEHRELPTSEDHLWGPRDYFKGEFYGKAECYFTSETGYHALNNKESLIKFIDKPWPLFINKELVYKENSRLLTDDNKPTKEYLCHSTSVVDDYNSPYAYRILLMANQVQTLFINRIDNLDDFIIASQISQAEAMKYFIERMRKDYKRNGGVIWWNLIDGWPQISDAIVDYYFSKKLAYDYIKKSQQATLLIMNEEDDELRLYCVSSERYKKKLSYEIIDAYNDTLVDKGEITTKPRDSFIVKNIKADDKTLLIIKFKDEKGNEIINHFHTHIIDIDLYKYINAMKKYGLIIK